MRRLADRLGVIYTCIALALAVAGWLVSGDPERFLPSSSSPRHARC